MKGVRCLCCGIVMTKKTDANTICSSCEGDIYRESLSEEYNYGRFSFTGLANLKPNKKVI